MTRNINRLWCKTRVISRWRSEPDCDKDLEDGSGGKKGMGREVGPDGVTRRDVNAGKMAASERWAGVGHTQAMMESVIRRYLTHMPPFVRSRAYHQGGVHIRLKEVASRLQRDVLDVEVEVAFQRRRYAGIRRTVRRRLRLVAVRLPESTEYRFYLTNIEPDSLDAHAVAQTYAARWQIELIFKELKSHYRLDELPAYSGEADHRIRSEESGQVITCIDYARSAWVNGAFFFRIDPFQLELVGVVDEAVEDGIGERGVAEQVVPFLERELTGDQGRSLRSPRGSASPTIAALSSRVGTRR